MRRLLGFVIFAVGIACLAVAVLTAASGEAFPWFGFAGPPLAVGGLVIAGARPLPSGGYNTNNHGQN